MCHSCLVSYKHSVTCQTLNESEQEFFWLLEQLRISRRTFTPIWWGVLLFIFYWFSCILFPIYFIFILLHIISLYITDSFPYLYSQLSLIRKKSVTLIVIISSPQSSKNTCCTSCIYKQLASNEWILQIQFKASIAQISWITCKSS